MTKRWEIYLYVVDILVDVYQLGQHIRQGNVDEAVDLAKKLAKQRVQLQANPSSQQREEKIIQYVKKENNLFVFT